MGAEGRAVAAAFPSLSLSQLLFAHPQQKGQGAAPFPPQAAAQPCQNPLEIRRGHFLMKENPTMELQPASAVWRCRDLIPTPTGVPQTGFVMEMCSWQISSCCRISYQQFCSRGCVCAQRRAQLIGCYFSPLEKGWSTVMTAAFKHILSP